MLAAHLVAASLATSEPGLPPARPKDMNSALAYAGAPPSTDDTVPETVDPTADQPMPPAEQSEAPPESPPPAATATPYEPEIVDLNRAGLKHDPLEGFNRVSFAFSQAVDKVLIRPLAMVYRHVIPRLLRDGIHNMLENLHEPIVFINDLLQLRPDRALHTLLRFVINSTLGLGGLFDIAKRDPFDIPHHNNGFGDTLGYYGVGPGPYIYVPILGPTTLRDATDNAEALVPIYPDTEPFNRQDWSIGTAVAGGLDQRERNDDDLKAMLSDAIDPYATFRADYLQDRQAEIEELKARKGQHAAVPGFDDPLTDPAATGGTPAGQ